MMNLVQKSLSQKGSNAVYPIHQYTNTPIHQYTNTPIHYKLLYKYGYLVIIGFLLTTMSLYPQAPIISIQFPSQNAINIANDVEISVTVDSNFVFDSSCVVGVYGIQEQEWDSVKNRYYEVQFKTFNNTYLLNNPTDFDIAKALGAKFYGSYQNSRLLNFTPKTSLDYSTLYGIEIQDLRVVNILTQDTILIDTIFYSYFTTTNPVPKIINFVNGIKEVYEPGETFSFELNTKISQTNTLLGDLIELYLDDSIRINADLSLNEDSTILVLNPIEYLLPNNHYSIRLRMDRLTGSIEDSSIVPIFIKGLTFIEVNSVNGINNNLSSEYCPNLRATKYYLSYGMPLTLTVEKNVGDLIFDKWVCPEDSIINGSRSLSITIEQNLSNFNDLKINALYKDLEKDEVTINNMITPKGHITILGSSQQIGPNQFELSKNKAVTYMAYPNYGWRFSHWESNDPSINGSTESSLTPLTSKELNQLEYKRILDINPVWDREFETTGCPNYHVKVKVKNLDDDCSTMANINDIIGVVVQGYSDSFTNDKCNEYCEMNFTRPLDNIINFSVNLKIPDLYEIMTIRETKNKICEGSKCNNNGLDDMLPFDMLPYNNFYSNLFSIENTEPCESTIIIEIRRKRVFLLIEEDIDHDENANEDTPIPFFDETARGVTIKQNNQSVYSMFENISKFKDIFDVDNNPNTTEVKYPYLGETIEPGTNMNRTTIIKRLYYVKIGYNIECRPWIADNLFGRTIGDWYIQPGYQSDDQDISTKILTFQISGDTKARHRYKEAFFIDRIGLLKELDANGSDSYDYIYTKDIINNSDERFVAGNLVSHLLIPRGNVQYPLNSFRNQNPFFDPGAPNLRYDYKATSLELHFTQPVSENSLKDNLVVVDIANVTSSSKRIDGEDLTSYSFNNNGNAIYGNDNQTIRFRLWDDNNIELPHNSEAQLIINFQNIYSSNNVRLAKPPISRMGFKTNLPKISVTLLSWSNHRWDEYFGDEVQMDITTLIGEPAVNSADKSTVHGDVQRFPFGMDWWRVGDGDNSPHGFDNVRTKNTRPIVGYQLTKESGLGLAFIAFDMDQDESLATKEILDATKQLFANTLPKEYVPVTDLVIETLKQWNRQGEGDDFKGRGWTYNLTYENNWGSKLNGKSIIYYNSVVEIGAGSHIRMKFHVSLY